MNLDTVRAEIADANRLCAEWESKTFYLGSPAAHCAKLRTFAGPALLAALDAGLVRIDMASDYYPPRYVLKEATA